MDPNPRKRPDVELMRDRRWLQQLALRLVRDADLAEELVQDTWLALLHRPPASTTPLRPWLVRVMKNLRFKKLRRAPMAEVPEDWEGRPESAPEERELCALLVDLVDALDEPYRSTVRLRYHEGLDSRAIGAQLGVAPGTVRWRLSQALDMLRCELDDRSGGDRKAWCLSMAPLVRAQVERAAGAGLLGASGGALFTWAWAVGLLLAGLAALWRLWGAPEGADALGEERLAATQAPPALAKAPVAEAAEPARPEPEPVREAVEQAPIQVLVRFVDREGAAVPEVVVEGVPEGRSDADGRLSFALDALPFAERDRERLGLRVLRARAPDGASLEQELASSEEGEWDIGELVLVPLSRLRGRVLDADGRGVAGALVLAQTNLYPETSIERVEKYGPSFRGESLGQTRTDVAGAFALDGVWSNTPLRLHAQHAQLGQAWSTPLDNDLGQQTEDVELVLDPWVGALRRPVIAVDGSPAHDVVCLASRGGDEGLSSWVLEGELRLNWASDGVEWVWLYDLKGEQGYAQLLAPELDDRTPIQLEPQPRLRIEATDDAGSALRQFRVQVLSPRHHGMLGIERFELEQDEQASLPLLPGVEVLARVDAEGHEAWVSRAFRLEDLEDGVLRAVLGRTARRSAVVTSWGAPVEGAEVELYGQMAPPSLMRTDTGIPVQTLATYHARDRSDAEGAVRLDLDATTEHYYLRYRAEGFGWHLHGPIGRGSWESGAAVQLELDEPGAVQGRITSAVEEDLSGVYVVASNGGPDHQRTRTDLHGRFHFDALAPGPWHVWVGGRRERVDGAEGLWLDSVPTGWEHPFNCVVRPGETVELVLDAARVARGRLAGVLELEGAAERDWIASLYTTGLGDPFRWPYRLSELVDPEGTFYLGTWECGEHLLSLQPVDPNPYQLRVLERVELGPEATPVSVRLAMGGLELDLGPRETWVGVYALVRIREGCIATVNVRPDEHGRMLVDELPAGAARIAVLGATDDAFEPWSWPQVLAEFEITPGRTTRLSL